MDNATSSPESRWQLTVISLGSLPLAQLPMLARGLARPLQDVAQVLCQAPAVLVDGLPAATAESLHEMLAELGLDLRLEPDGTPTPGTPLFDVAAHVSEPARAGDIADALGDFLGVDSARALALLATPPGILLGRVGAALIDTLEERLGSGVLLTRAACEEGRFDLHVAPGARLPAGLATALGEPLPAPCAGLIPLGLDVGESQRLWPHLKGRSDIRLINRRLVRWDLVLLSPAAALPHRVSALEALFGIPAKVAGRVLDSAPLALAEALLEEEAERLAGEARRLGLEVALEPAGFDRVGLWVDSARDAERVRTTLSRLGMPSPMRFPALVGEDLADLEARILARALADVGARTRFVETGPREARP